MLQKSPEISRTCLTGLSGSQMAMPTPKTYLQKGRKTVEKQWNLFVTEVNPCFSWVNVYLFTPAQM